MKDRTKVILLALSCIVLFFVAMAIDSLIRGVAFPLPEIDYRIFYGLKPRLLKIPSLDFYYIVLDGSLVRYNNKSHEKSNVFDPQGATILDFDFDSGKVLCYRSLSHGQSELFIVDVKNPQDTLNSLAIENAFLIDGIDSVLLMDLSDSDIIGKVSMSQRMLYAKIPYEGETKGYFVFNSISTDGLQTLAIRDGKIYFVDDTTLNFLYEVGKRSRITEIRFVRGDTILILEDNRENLEWIVTKLTHHGEIMEQKTIEGVEYLTIATDIEKDYILLLYQHTWEKFLYAFDVSVLKLDIIDSEGNYEKFGLASGGYLGHYFDDDGRLFILESSQSPVEVIKGIRGIPTYYYCSLTDITIAGRSRRSKSFKLRDFHHGNRRTLIGVRSAEQEVN